jgi:hypothetical protein
LTTSVNDDPGPPEHPDGGAGVVLAIELQPLRQVIKLSESPKFVATLTNLSAREITLVEPNHGSICDWRTPVLEWSAGTIPSYCTPMMGIRKDEVFSLKPNESRQLKRPLEYPVLPGPGMYSLRLTYTNDPSHPCLGHPLAASKDRPLGGVLFGAHKPGAMKLVRASTTASAVSNAVEVVIEP